MCWDKQTSIITFILGTVVNIFNIFLFLERRSLLYYPLYGSGYY